MKRIIPFVIFFFSLLLNSCSTDTTVSSNNVDQGGITLNIDRIHKPDNVVSVTAYMTREGFDTLSGSLNLLSDTTADITFNDLSAGGWHLKVDAADEENTVVYTGQADVNILAGITTQVYLTLEPTGAGKGNIYIFVNWGVPGNIGWIDFENNPIVVKYNTGYDLMGVGECYVLKDENNYKMWYTGLTTSGVGYGFYAFSSDGLNWTRYSSTPVLFPGPYGSWDSYHLSPGPVIKEDGIYKMYYSGWQETDGIWYIGLATSSDGFNWVKYAGNPIISGGDWDYHIGAQSIIKKGATYYMFYTGSPANYGGYIYHIGVATSSDGYSWQKYSGNPVMSETEPWEGSAVAFPSVIYDNDQFQMVYEGVKQQNSAFGFAYSDDGYSWTKDSNNPFFKTEDCTNEWNKIIYPTYIKVENSRSVYYTGKDSNGDIAICVTRKLN